MQIIKNLIQKNKILTKFSLLILNFFRRAAATYKWRKLKSANVIKLNIGAGGVKGTNDWKTIDLGNADISWDLRRGIALPDASVDEIYSSHLLEHIRFADQITLLKECYRVLKIGGRLNICVPNAGYYLRAYSAGKLFRERDTWHVSGAVNTGSVIDQINFVAYMGSEHKYMFDEENIISTLKLGGFEHVSQTQFGHELDDPNRAYESLYAEARK